MKTGVVMARQTDTHRTFHRKSESGCLKFGVTPVGGGVAGLRPELVAIGPIRNGTEVITKCEHQDKHARTKASSSHIYKIVKARGKSSKYVA